VTSAESGSEEKIDGQVGRGYFWVTAGKLWFLVTATVLNIGLPRLLGDPARFGAYKVVAGFLAVVSMVMLNGALYTASKASSETPGFVRSLCQRLQRTAGLISFGLALTIFLMADLIAAWFWSDPSLVAPLRVATGVVFSYGLYATWIGVANGLKNFRLQALFDMAFATLKVSAIIGAVILGAGVMGIFASFSAVAMLMACAAFVLIFMPLRDESADAPKSQFMSTRTVLKYMASIMGAFLAMNILLQGDVVLLKGLLHEVSYESLGSQYGGWGVSVVQSWFPGGEKLQPLMVAREISSALTGVYAGTRNITMIPYQGIIPLTFVVFPVLSAASFRGDNTESARLVKGAIRFAILLVCLLCGGLVLSEDMVLSLLFGKLYGSGQAFMVPMVVGTLSFALYVVLTSMLTAAGYPGRVMVVGLCAAAVHLGLMVAASRLDGLPFERAIHVAWASSLGPFAGTVTVVVILKRKLGVTFPWLSLLRAALSTAGVTWLVAYWLPLDGILALGLRFMVYLSLILISWVIVGELRRAEAQQLRRFLGRKVES